MKGKDILFWGLALVQILFIFIIWVNVIGELSLASFGVKLFFIAFIILVIGVEYLIYSKR